MVNFDFALYPFDAQRVSIEIDEERHNVSTCGTRTFFDADDVPSTFLDATSQWSLEGAPHSRRDPATGACTIELTVRKQQVAPSWWSYPLPSPEPHGGSAPPQVRRKWLGFFLKSIAPAILIVFAVRTSPPTPPLTPTPTPQLHTHTTPMPTQTHTLSDNDTPTTPHAPGPLMPYL